MKRLLILTALIEVPTGLGLIVAPTVVVQLLLGSSLDTSIAVLLGRVAGIAVFALGLACWLARDDAQSRAARGLVVAMLLYNAAVAALLVYAGICLGLHGIAIWPVVVIHAIMAVWCTACLRRSSQIP
jgi:hypothetical protein